MVFSPCIQQRLIDELEKALDVFRVSAAKHTHEQFYMVGLYAGGDYSFVADTTATTEGLEKVAREYLGCPQDRQGEGVNFTMQGLKWAPCVSPHHREFEGRFAGVNRVLDAIWKSLDDSPDEVYQEVARKIHDTCMGALYKIRSSGLFDENVVFNLVMGDQSNEEMFLNAECLNGDKVLGRFRSELDIDGEQLEDLRVKRWRV